MSPRKTRRAAKTNNADESLMNATLSTTRQAETPNVTLRSKRVTRQAKNKSDSDDEMANQSPLLLNSTARSTRKVKKSAANIDESLNVTAASAKKRSRKIKLPDSPVIDNNDSSALKNKKKTRGRKNKVINDEKLNENNETIADDEIVTKEDNEVAKVSEKILKMKDLSLPRFRELRRRDSSNLNDTTPESSPITVDLTPHRSTKTPRKSPVNIGSPKTHSLSPKRKSKTPRKLPVTSFPSEQFVSELDTSIDDLSLKKNQSKGKSSSSLDDLSLKDNKSKRKSSRLDVSLEEDESERKSSSLDDLSLKENKSEDESLKEKKSKRKSSPRSDKINNSKAKLIIGKSKTPKIVLRTSKSKSPKLRSVKKLNTTKSPQEKLLNNKEKILKVVLDNVRSPQVILKRVSTTLLSPAITTTTTTTKPIASVTPTKKTDIKSPSLEIDPEPVNEEPKTPLKPIITTRFHKISKSSTPIQSRNENIKLSSSTPREKGLGNLNSSSILSVDTFYGTSPKISSTKINESCIADESSPLISEDDGSFEISGITAANNTTINKDEEEKESNKDKDDTYELPEPKTPNLRNKKNDTYELEEPKTPSLKKSAKKRSIVDEKNDKKEKKNDDDNNDNEVIKKRICKVRFASPALDEKINNSTVEKVLTSRLATPAMKNVNKAKGTWGDKSIPSLTERRKRSSSLTNLNNKTPTSIVKRRSNSNVDESRGKTSAVKAQNESVNRLSRPRQSLTSDKKNNGPKLSARKIPNFAQIHQKKFSEMESLVDVKKRIESRHNELTSNSNSSALNVSKSFGKIGQNVGIVKPVKSNNVVKQINPPAPNGAYNRFGFKTRKQEAIQNVSKEAAPEKIQAKKELKRQIVKGVRQNRRFELMMKSRNIN